MVVLLVEAQCDAVAVAAGGLAALGDAGAEAGHTEAPHAEVAVRTVAGVCVRRDTAVRVECLS